MATSVTINWTDGTHSEFHLDDEQCRSLEDWLSKDNNTAHKLSVGATDYLMLKSAIKYVYITD